MALSSPYYFVRHSWGRVDVERLVKDLGSVLEVVPLDRPEPESTSVIGRDAQEKYLVRADTLRAYLSLIRAILFQKERRRFTERDLRPAVPLFKCENQARTQFLQTPSKCISVRATCNGNYAFPKKIYRPISSRF